MKNICKCGHEEDRHYSGIYYCSYDSCTCKKFEPKENQDESEVIKAIKEAGYEKQKICKCGYERWEHNSMHNKSCKKFIPQEDTVGSLLRESHYWKKQNHSPSEDLPASGSSGGDNSPQGCGKPWYNEESNEEVLCGEFNELCKFCKPKNHSPSEERSSSIDYNGKANNSSGGDSPKICPETPSRDTLISKIKSHRFTRKDYCIAVLDIKDFIQKIESDLRKKRYPFTYDEVVEIIRKRAGAKFLK